MSRDKAQAVLDKCAQRLDYLAARWQDEKQYEDFQEYRDAATKAILDAGGASVSVSRNLKRVTFTADNEPYTIVIGARSIALQP